MNSNALDLHTTESPSHELAFGIFSGSWISCIPGYGVGKVNLFEDSRITWFDMQCDGFAGKTVLELGPLEGGHTYMLSKARASHITSIESNSKAFLKCLIVQNALKFDADFLFGDFRKTLAQHSKKYDVVLASGVLYHMADPIGLLSDMAATADSICLWTQYYDAAIVDTHPKASQRIDASATFVDFHGKRIELHRHNYLTDDLSSETFAGGTSPYSNWMTRDGIVDVLESLGMRVVVGRDDRDHPAGPAITLFATRKPPFNEENYLSRHPDVAAAVEAGKFKSGEEHYFLFGKAEGRSAS
ncbi:class I SAM-dependent methyltransferase [Burkholderia cenocepacia]